MNYGSGSDRSTARKSPPPHTHYFLALAVDYDGTLAQNGLVSNEALAALRELKSTGRRLLLVTGRELDKLRLDFPETGIFDRIVAENGAVVYDPETGFEQALAAPPSPVLVQRLLRDGVEPLSVGHAVVAAWQPHRQAVLDAIQDLGLELQIIFNKGAIMVLPAGITKATGLRMALKALDISPINTVGVGDAENDHAFLQACGCAVAVANALPAIKEQADIVLVGDHGTGVAEIARRLIGEDASLVPPSCRGLLVGTDRSGTQLYIEPGQTVLIAGNSGSGKSSFATLLTERMVQRGFEFCVIDPEGDYVALKDAVTIGDVTHAPATEEAMRLLLLADVNVVINVMALGACERQVLFQRLLPTMLDLRARSGRPHWLLVDEAHYLLPARAAKTVRERRQLPAGAILVTVDPFSIDPDVLRRVDVILSMGSTAPDVLASCMAMKGVAADRPAGVPGHDEFIYWSCGSAAPPCVLRREPPRQPHNRHSGKYATGDVGDWKSFYFRGPDGSLNLQARNLREFVRLSLDVSDTVWEHHLHAGDYSSWFRHVMKDDFLADRARAAESDVTLSPIASRDRIAKIVRERYAI